MSALQHPQKAGDGLGTKTSTKSVFRYKKCISLPFFFSLFIAHWQGHVSFTIWKLCHALFTDTYHPTKKALASRAARRNNAVLQCDTKNVLTAFLRLQSTFYHFLSNTHVYRLVNTFYGCSKMIKLCRKKNRENDRIKTKFVIVCGNFTKNKVNFKA